MIGQVQPQYVILHEITDWEMESTDYDNMESTEEVGPDPVTCNVLTTLTMCDPIQELPELFPEEKPTKLPTLKYCMGIMHHRIDVIPESHWSPRFPSTYNQFKDHITEKINIELGTGRVVPSRSRNAIGMFTQPRRDKPHEARFLLYCIVRNLVTHKDKPSMPSMEQIIDFVGSRPFRSKLDLTDRYYNIRIHPESVKDSTCYCHMGKYDPLVMQQDDCNAPATMMRAMNFLFRNLQDLMICFHDLLIVNYTDEEYINTMSARMKIAPDNKLWFKKTSLNSCLQECRSCESSLQIKAWRQILIT